MRVRPGSRDGARLVGDDAFRRLWAARQWMLDAPDEPLTVEALAAEAEMSPYHFLRSFRRAFGATPAQHLRSIRIERARRLLAAGASVTEVCFEVGFSSVGSFSSLFSRQVGLSPRAFQRRVRRVVQVPDRISRVYVPSCATTRATGSA